MKLFSVVSIMASSPLLLARGACIETLSHPNGPCFLFSSCSSQEEHVLKLQIHQREIHHPLLLLARGACIETSSSPDAPTPEPSCSSQEEHVLKLLIRLTVQPLVSCSSQEEHVLKRRSASVGAKRLELLLARGACIETSSPPTPVSPKAIVAPRKRSMY